MSVTGEIKNLYSDKDKTRVLLPRTKTKAVSDENGTSLDVLLDGKAPAGYGYGGETMPIISGSDSDLNSILSSMKFDSAKQFCFTGGDSTFNGLGWFYGTIYKTDDTHATIHAYNYYNNSTLRRSLSGTWEPWEWVNPRGTLGVEYRTTERWEGEVVYTMFYSGGASATNLIISAPTGAKRLVRYKVWHGTSLLPVGDDTKTSYYANTYLNGTSIVYLADSKSDGYGNGGTNLRVQAWYTK